MLTLESFDAALVPGFRAAVRPHYKAFSREEQARIVRLEAGEDRPFHERDCPACDAPVAQALAMPGFSRPRFRLVRCHACRLVYSRDVLDEDADRIRYAPGADAPDAVPDAFAALKRNTAYAALEAGKLAYIAQQAEGLLGRPSRLLDIGCANGVTLDTFAARGWEVAGVEPTATFAEQARARHPGVRTGFFPQDAPPGPFGLVTLFDVLEHIERPLPFLRAAFASLAPGGVLAVQVPNFDSPLVQIEQRRSTVVTLGHWSYFDPASLQDLLARAGFLPLALQSYISELDRLLEHPAAAVRAALGPWAPDDLTRLRPADLFWRQLGFKLFGLFQRPR